MDMRQFIEFTNSEPASKRFLKRISRELEEGFSLVEVMVHCPPTS